MLSICRNIKDLIALCLNAMLNIGTTTAHRILLATKTLRAKLKPDKGTNHVPTDAANATAGRPLGTHPGTRRLTAGFLAIRLTSHSKAFYTSLNQYGLIPAGIEVASRKHQLNTDLRPPPFAQAALDIKNAHTSAARRTIFRVLLGRFLTTKHPLDHLFLLYFLAYYSHSTTTLIQVGNCFLVYFQTNGLDQGEALAAHAFGLALGVIISTFLLPAIPDLVCTLVHDDTTFAHFPLNPLHSPPPGDMPQISASYTPLPFAIDLYATLLKLHLDCELAGHKSVIFQPVLPPHHPLSIHLLADFFPRGSKLTSSHFILAGIPIAKFDYFGEALSNSLIKYDSLLQRLLNMPKISMQMKLLVLTISCRPTSTFAHFLRALPPSVTTGIFLDSLPTHLTPLKPSFAQCLRYQILRAFARILNIPAASISSSLPSEGTTLQILLRAKDGGVSLPDPVSLAPASFLGSFADTLPALLEDPFLHPFLTNTAAWPISPSPTLRDGHSYFHSITTLSALSPSSKNFSPSAVTTLLLTLSNTYSISLLHAIAGHHAQSIFSNAIFNNIISRLLSPQAGLTSTALARIRHSAAPGSAHFFSIYRLMPAFVLTNAQFQFLITHRLGLHPQFLPYPLPPHCHPRCSSYPPPRPFPLTDPDLRRYALHAAACQLFGFRNARHNDVTKIIGRTAEQELGLRAEYQRNMASSATSGTRLDLTLESFHLSPPVIGIDVTISNPLLPTHRTHAAKNAAHLFHTRALEKDSKHRAGCIDQGRAFLPLVFTTLGGIGPPRALEFLDSLFRVAWISERDSGGSGQETSRRRLAFYNQILACITRGTTKMVAEIITRTTQP